MFFSFPHIGIDSKGVVGNISRPGRSAMSCACGALIKSLSDIKRDGLTCTCKPPGGALWTSALHSYCLPCAMLRLCRRQLRERVASPLGGRGPWQTHRCLSQPN